MPQAPGSALADDRKGVSREVALAEEFAAAADRAHYQMFLTSYDAVLVFVQNRTPRSFEIRAVSGQNRKQPRSTCCAYRVVARRLRVVIPDGC